MKKMLAALALALTLLLSCGLAACNIPELPGLPAVSTESAAPSTPGETVPEVEACPDAADGRHTDADDNGTCDACESCVLVCIDFYAINDLHGKFKDAGSQIGVDELSTYLTNAAQTDDHTVLLSAGDMWQGSSESNLTKGLIMTDWMNELDFSAMALGNHEFDWGESYIEANAAAAQFPLLAINVFDRETQTRVDYCDASVLVERGGARIGIIGAIGDCYSSISGDSSGGVYFKVREELTALVKAEAASLRKQGADYIVYLLHDGYGESRTAGSISNAALSNYYDPILSDGTVDLVFEGHTHQRYALVDQSGVYHLQGGGENRGISHVEVSINVANQNSTVHTAEYLQNSVYAGMDDHPIVAELLEKYKDQVSVGTEILGENARRRDSDELRTIIAELYYEVGARHWGEDYDLVLGGGFLSVRSPYSLAPGKVTYAQLQTLLPFDNTLVLCSVKGRDLQNKFIYTDNENYFCYYGEYGQSVKDRIDPNATYYIIVDAYTSTYAPNRLTEIERYTADVFARDLLAEHIRNGGLAQ